MPISEAARADLYTGLVEVLGPDRAETLMAHLPRFDPADVATKSDVAAVKTEIAAVKTEIGELRSGVRGEIGELRSGLRGEIAELRSGLRGEIAELRSELKSEIGEVRDGLAAVNQRLDRLFQTLLVGMFGVAAAFIGLIFRIG